MARKEVNKVITFTITGRTSAYVTTKKDQQEILRSIRNALSRSIAPYLDINCTNVDGVPYEGSTGLTTCRVKVSIKE